MADTDIDPSVNELNSNNVTKYQTAADVANRKLLKSFYKTFENF
jgi:hypothetical protein